MNNQIGKTIDIGFQFGIRKTMLVSTEKVWIGKLKNELELKKEFETQNGITEFVRVFKSNSHIRLNWKPEN